MMPRLVTIAALLVLAAATGCSSAVRIPASPYAPYPVMLNEGKTLDGSTLPLGPGRPYRFSDNLMNTATQSSQRVGNVVITTQTTTFYRRRGNPDFHYRQATLGNPNSILVQRIRCSAYFFVTVGAAINRALCEVEGTAHAR